MSIAVVLLRNDLQSQYLKIEVLKPSVNDIYLPPTVQLVNPTFCHAVL